MYVCAIYLFIYLWKFVWAVCIMHRLRGPSFIGYSVVM